MRDEGLQDGVGRVHRRADEFRLDCRMVGCEWVGEEELRPLVAGLVREGVVLGVRVGLRPRRVEYYRGDILRRDSAVAPAGIQRLRHENERPVALRQYADVAVSQVGGESFGPGGLV